MAVRQAFHIATTGRPGPTLIDVPKDVLQNEMDWYWPTDQEVLDSLPGYRPNTKGHPRMIKEAATSDPRSRSARSSTPAVASSRHAPQRRCASSPS